MVSEAHSIRITVRLSADILQEFLDVINKEGYKNLSEGLRGAIAEFIDNHELKLTTERVVIELPRGLTYEIDRIVNISYDFTDRHELILYAVRKYIEEFKKAHVEQDIQFHTALQAKRRNIEAKASSSIEK